MKKIPSFTVDHIRLQRGIFVSRKDEVGGEIVTTFDIRMKEPNREPALGPAAIHTIEHLAATFLRNHPVWADKIIYWGPMGCLTGNYLIVKGDLQSKDIAPLMTETFRFIADYEGEVPGASAKDCGNYLMMNLPMAKRCWKKKLSGFPIKSNYLFQKYEQAISRKTKHAGRRFSDSLPARCQYFQASTAVLPKQYFSTFKEVLEYCLRRITQPSIPLPFLSKEEKSVSHEFHLSHL